MTPVNALSVDVEDYYHALVFREATRRLGSVAWRSRVETNVEHVLALLRQAGVRATFFTLGEVAEEHPTLVRRVAAEGHEVACHGYRHERVDGMTPEEFRADVRRARAVLEDQAGQPVWGYRAPNFSIGRTETWAYDVLLEEGFRYDSSTYPIRHDRYGTPNAPRFPYGITCRSGAILTEFPVGTVRLLGANLPVGGGGYFRLLPLAWATAGIRRVNRREGGPLMFYFHPWELDACQPRPPMRWDYRLRHYVGIDREAGKLARLFRHLPFTTAREVLRLA